MNPRVYIILLGVSLIGLLLDAFFFKVSGAIGLALCILLVYFLVGSIIRLCRLMQVFDDKIMEKIDILFF